MPWTAASAIMPVSRRTARIASSFPGMRYVDLIGIGIGIGDGDHRNLELLRFGHSQMLALGIDDKERGRELGHIAHTTECALQPLELLRRLAASCFGSRSRSPRSSWRSMSFMSLRRPRMVAKLVSVPPSQRRLMIVLAGTQGLGRDHFLRLLLGADEEDLAAISRGLFDELERLAQVPSVWSRSMTWMPFRCRMDIGLHLRIPAFGLVSEVHAGLQHLHA